MNQEEYKILISMPRKRTTRSNRHVEATIQAEFFRWVRHPVTVKRFPGIEWIHSSLAGAYFPMSETSKRAGVNLAAVNAKRQGGKTPGIWDVFLPHALYHNGVLRAGLYIEFKAKTDLTREQESFRLALQPLYAFCVCHSVNEAIAAINSYYDKRRAWHELTNF
jgi:hypothetical protein